MTKKGAGESTQEGQHDLEESLRLAVKEPKHIHTKDGGAILALCVHCESPIDLFSGLALNCLICSKMRGPSLHVSMLAWAQTQGLRAIDCLLTVNNCLHTIVRS